MGVTCVRWIEYLQSMLLCSLTQSWGCLRGLIGLKLALEYSFPQWLSRLKLYWGLPASACVLRIALREQDYTVETNCAHQNTVEVILCFLSKLRLIWYRLTIYPILGIRIKPIENRSVWDVL